MAVRGGLPSEVGMQDGSMRNCRARFGAQRRRRLARRGVAFEVLVAVTIGETCRQCAGVIVARCLAKQRTVRRRRWFEISHNGDVAATGSANPEDYVRRGRQLEYFTIGYNSLEGLTSICCPLDCWLHIAGRIRSG